MWQSPRAMLNSKEQVIPLPGKLFLERVRAAKESRQRKAT